MPRTPKHAAHVSWTLAGTFRVAKRLNGKGDYAIETASGYNCYALAMDMARENGKNVTITKEAADHMRAMACGVDFEWTIAE